MLAQFLTEIDGLSQNEKAPFIIVATNRPQDMDEAFYRLLPNKVYFEMPGEEAKKQILEGLVKGDLDGDDGAGVKCEKKDGSVTVEALARQMVGYSGSDLKNLCAEAALFWAVERVKEWEATQEKDKEENEMKDNAIEGEKRADGKYDEAKDEEVKDEEVKDGEVERWR